VLLRRMTPADVEPVAEIERSSVSPWDSAQIANELRYPASLTLVAEAEDGSVCGWCCGRYAGDEAELLKIAVRPEMKRVGIGDKLLERFEQLVAENGVTQVFLEVRSRNEPALRLYRKHGFSRIGRRCGYYSNPPDDALILKK